MHAFVMSTLLLQTLTVATSHCENTGMASKQDVQRPTSLLLALCLPVKSFMCNTSVKKEDHEAVAQAVHCLDAGACTANQSRDASTDECLYEWGWASGSTAESDTGDW